jgi:hypothetical protein
LTSELPGRSSYESAVGSLPAASIAVVFDVHYSATPSSSGNARQVRRAFWFGSSAMSGHPEPGTGRRASTRAQKRAAHVTSHGPAASVTTVAIVLLAIVLGSGCDKCGPAPPPSAEALADQVISDPICRSKTATTPSGCSLRSSSVASTIRRQRATALRPLLGKTRAPQRDRVL